MQQIAKLAKRRYWQLAVSAIGPGTATAVIELAITGGTTGWLPVGIALASGLMVLAVLWVLDGPQPEPQPVTVRSPPLPTDQPEIVQPPPLPAHLAQDRIFSPRSPDELVAEVKGMTDIMRQHAIERHLGQWLCLTGHIRDVRQIASVNVITVSADLTNGDSAVLLRFDASYWQPRLQAANIGDMISAIGKIKDVACYGGDGFVSLDECELLHLNDNLPTS